MKNIISISLVWSFIFGFVTTLDVCGEPSSAAKKLADHVSGKPNWFFSLHSSHVAVLRISGANPSKKSFWVSLNDDGNENKLEFQIWDVKIEKVIYIGCEMILSDTSLYNLRNKNEIQSVK